MQIFALYSGYIKVLQNSFDPIEIMMSICIQVALLLGIFLSSSLAQKTKFCANSVSVDIGHWATDSVAQCQSQCTSSGGYILSFAGYCDLANPVCISLVDAVTSSGILKAKQKLGVTFNFDKSLI